MSPNVRKGKAYTDLNYVWMQKSLDISAISFHKVMQVAYQRDMVNSMGSILGFLHCCAAIIPWLR